MTAILDPDSDPGRNWRRLARVGALFYTVSFVTLVFSWRYFELMIHAAWRIDIFDVGIGTWRHRFIWCLFLTSDSVGPCMILACSKRALDPGRRKLALTSIVFLWIVSVLPPFMFGIRQLPSISEDEFAVLIGLLCLFAYVFIGGMTYLQTRRHKHAPLYPFWFGVLPLVCAAAANICDVSLELPVVLSSGPSPYRIRELFAFFAWISGSLMMLIGWIMWWRAVKKELTKSKSARAANKLTTEAFSNA